MNAQPSLFTTTNGLAGYRYEVNPLARTSDPVTSHQAAASTARRFRAGSQKAVLLAVFVEGGPMTTEQAGTRSGLALNPTAGYWKRVSELLRGGYLADTGQTALSACGEHQRIIEATDLGRAAYAAEREAR